MIPGSKELIEYGQRSRFVTSVRIQHPVGGRPSPDAFGRRSTWPRRCRICWRGHAIVAPLYSDDPRRLLPDIDPKQHTLMIHGLVDRP